MEQTAGLRDSSQKELSAIHFSLILNEVFLEGEVSRKLVVCFTDPF